MRKAIFLAIADALCPENPADPNADTSKNIVPYVDLWNDQVNLLGGGSAFETPAVFVEFEQIDWRQQNAGARRGDVPVRLHIVTRAAAAHGSHDPHMAEVLEVFDLIDAINAKMHGLRGEGIRIENGSITPTYIQYLWVRQQSDLSNKTVIYVPTETNLPILESTRTLNVPKQ